MQTIQVNGVSLGSIGYGAMNLTWRPVVTPDDKASAVLKAAIDGSAGIAFINSGEFYGQHDRNDGLKLLNRFFTANPEYAKKCYLSVKGAVRPDFTPDSSDEGLLESVTTINKLLGDHKKMDLFEPARVDKTRPIEETMKALKKLADQGHFKDIGLSEVSADTIRRAHAVAPVAAVEAEYSLWALDIEKNGVLATCKELGIALVAYSPLGRGFLTGSLKSADDIPEGDFRKLLDRFQPENFSKNLALVDEINAFAAKKGVTAAQLSLAWILAQWEGIIVIPGSTRLEGVKESQGAQGVKLSQVDLDEIRKMVDGADIVGGRYNQYMEGGLAA